MLNGCNFQSNDYHNPDHYIMSTGQRIKADTSYSIQTYKYGQVNKQLTFDSFYRI